MTTTDPSFMTPHPKALRDMRSKLAAMRADTAQAEGFWRFLRTSGSSAQAPDTPHAAKAKLDLGIKVYGYTPNGTLVTIDPLPSVIVLEQEGQPTERFADVDEAVAIFVDRTGSRTQVGEAPVPDEDRGVYRKYDIRRTDGSSEPGGKHENCAYFVLDLEHDPFSHPALRAYADACAPQFPKLAEDILRALDTRPCGCRSVGECSHLMSPQTPSEAFHHAMARSEAELRREQVAAPPPPPADVPAEGPPWAYVFAEGDHVLVLACSEGLSVFLDTGKMPVDATHHIDKPPQPGLWFWEGSFGAEHLVAEGTDEPVAKTTRWRRCSLRDFIHGEAPAAEVSEAFESGGGLPITPEGAAAAPAQPLPTPVPRVLPPAPIAGNVFTALLSAPAPSEADAPKGTGGLWRKSGIAGGKYLVQRRDGTVPEWPYIVLGARDPAAPAALFAYADEARSRGFDQQYVDDVRSLAHEFITYQRTHGAGDPDARPHRKDDPATVARMAGCGSV